MALQDVEHPDPEEAGSCAGQDRTVSAGVAESRHVVVGSHTPEVPANLGEGSRMGDILEAAIESRQVAVDQIAGSEEIGLVGKMSVVVGTADEVAVALDVDRAGWRPVDRSGQKAVNHSVFCALAEDQGHERKN